MSRFLLALQIAPFAATILAGAGAIHGADANWPQWRGPTRDSLLPAQTWPEKLDAERLKVMWRVELGPSYSGPIVSEKSVFITETRDKKQEVVQALERKTGELQWSFSWDGAISVPFFAASNGSWIRATPAYDGERLYVAGMKDVLVCLNADSGKELWRVDFVKDYASPVPAFGFVSSPLVSGDSVYVQAGSSFVKLDKRTGKEIWRTLKDSGGMNGSAFSSPVLAKLNGTPQLIVQTRDKLAGVDENSGKELWSKEIPAFRGMNILTPTVVNNSIFTSAYGGKSLSLQVDVAGSAFTPTVTWENKTQGYMSSPVVIGSHAYLHLRNQRFTCIDLATGKETWTTKPYGQYWSMVAQGDRILALDERGELLLIRANPEKFELLDARKISDDSTWAHLAVCGDEVFIRELGAMAVYRWK
jgi:outer membrane protein assembly factor BamB